MGHKYEASHPWLTFSLNLERFSPQLWMLMGEARSKVEHIAGVPLRPATNRELHILYLAKGLHGTAAIEGNTLTEEQVREHLQGSLHLPDSQAYLTMELDNIVNAFNTARDVVLNEGESALTPGAVVRLNGMILKGLTGEDEPPPGRIRKRSVVVASYRGAPHEDCAYLLRRMCEWLTGPEFSRAEEWGVSLDIVRAVLAHLYIAWIHPFDDGNGRTARLVEAVILMARGVPTPACHLLSNHYNATREEYYRRLNEAIRGPDFVIAFIQYAVQGFVEQLTQQIEVIRGQQHDQAWQDFVEDTFRGRAGAPAHRQRLIALELGRRNAPVRPSDFQKLSAEIALSYVGKGTKTVTRDINALTELGLVDRTSHGCVAKTEVVSAFLPSRAEPGSLSVF